MHDKLLLERYSAGETTEEEARLVREHCATCAECVKYLDNLANERKRFLSAHPFSSLEFVRPKPVSVRSPWRRSFLEKLRQPALFPAYGLVVMLLLASPIVYFNYVHRPISDEIVFKGGASVSFLLKRNNRISECTPRDTLYAGDEVQVLYSTPKTGYVGLLSVDSRGKISWYYPDPKNPVCSVPAKPGGKRSFPAAILLDESKGQELIITLFSNAPLFTDAVAAWVGDAMQKTNTNLSELRRQLDSTHDKIRALPRMTIFQKG